MARRLISSARGFVHDIETVVSLSDDPNNMRLLSDRSLYILQNLSLEDITFLSRYGEILAGDFYLPVVAGTQDASDVSDAIDLVRRDLNSMSIEGLMECICEAVSILAEQGESAGQTVEASDSDGSTSIGPGEQFPDQAAYFDAKCAASNGIFDTIKGVIEWLDDNYGNLILNVFGGITSGVILALVASGPVGWTVAVVAIIVSAIAGYLVATSIDFVDLIAALADTHDTCVEALYNSDSGGSARDNFVAAAGSGTPSISVAEEGLLNLLLTAEMVNQLFNPRSDLVTYVSPDPVVCVGGLLLHWPFNSDMDGFVFTDVSTGTNSATGVWDANSGDGAVMFTLTNTGDNNKASGEIEKTGLSQAVGLGNSAQFDYSATSDGENMTKLLEVVFSDMTTDSVSVGSSKSAGTIILPFTESKTLTEVKLTISRTWGQSGVSKIYVPDGRVQ